MKLIQIVNKDNASISTNAYLLESEKVKVFPCAYRGFKEVEILDEAGISSESKQIFDPEANGFTEYNFANIYGKQTKLISWSGDLQNALLTVITLKLMALSLIIYILKVNYINLQLF